MNADDEARASRAAARARWPGAVVRLDDVPEVDVLRRPPGELVGMVRDLTLAAWSMAGRPIPDYDRAHMPGRVVRTGEA
ncbi:MAG: hypothetical protein ACQEXJ_10220 [Myxococcota bacterium]